MLYVRVPWHLLESGRCDLVWDETCCVLNWTALYSIEFHWVHQFLMYGMKLNWIEWNPIVFIGLKRIPFHGIELIGLNGIESHFIGLIRTPFHYVWDWKKFHFMELNRIGLNGILCSQIIQLDGMELPCIEWNPIAFHSFIFLYNEINRIKWNPFIVLHWKEFHSMQWSAIILYEFWRVLYRMESHENAWIFPFEKILLDWMGQNSMDTYKKTFSRNCIGFHKKLLYVQWE